GYWMDYHNQLIPTGQINDVGEYTRMNVKDSYRIGLEFDAAWKPAKTWALNANLTLSRSRIPEFTEYVDAMIGEDYTDQAVFHLKDTPIALSPEVVAGAGVRWMPVSGAA